MRSRIAPIKYNLCVQEEQNWSYKIHKTDLFCLEEQNCSYNKKYVKVYKTHIKYHDCFFAKNKTKSRFLEVSYSP